MAPSTAYKSSLEATDPHEPWHAGYSAPIRHLSTRIIHVNPRQEKPADKVGILSENLSRIIPLLPQK